MSLSEIVSVNNKKISCDGSKIIEGNNQLFIAGHPRIYLDMGTKDSITCPYCGRHFTEKKRIVLLALQTHLTFINQIIKTQIND
jgi:uncharacterized Zn-finger protein